MEGDESRLTFESPNLFGSKEGGPRERERERNVRNAQNGRKDEGKEDETRFRVRVSQKGSHGTRNTIIDGDWLFQPGVSLSNTRDS